MGKRRIIKNSMGREKTAMRNGKPSDVLFYDLNEYAVAHFKYGVLMPDQKKDEFANNLKKFIEMSEETKCYSLEQPEGLCAENRCLFANQQNWISELERKGVDCLCDFLWMMHGGNIPPVRFKADVLDHIIDARGRATAYNQT